MGRRIRTLKPEILDDEITAALPHLEWRLFSSIVLMADDYGNLRGDPGWVLGQALWACRETVATVADALAELERRDLIMHYRVRGQLYIAVVGWSKHQKVDKPGKPAVPAPDEQDPPLGHPALKALPAVSSASRDSREGLAPGSGIWDLGSGIEDPPAPARDPEAIPPKLPEQPTGDLVRQLEASDAGLRDRQKLRDRKWRELDALRQTIARELGVEVRPLLAQDPGERALAMRIREAPDLARAEADIDHVLAIYAAEARLPPGSVQWLTGAMFEERSYRRALGMTLADVASEHARKQQRAGPSRFGPKSAEAPRRIKTL